VSKKLRRSSKCKCLNYDDIETTFTSGKWKRNLGFERRNLGFAPKLGHASFFCDS
jgi:hypothetical protein